MLNNNEPTGPALALTINNEDPAAIFAEIIRQCEIVQSGDWQVGLAGKEIGVVNDPPHPIKGIRTSVHGIMRHTAFEDIPNKPGHRRGVGTPRREFNIATSFELQNHSFLDATMTADLIEVLRQFGYESHVSPIENGNRMLVIETPLGTFNFLLGWENAHGLAEYHQRTIASYKVNYPALVETESRMLQSVLDGKEPSSLRLEPSNAHPTVAPSSIPIESNQRVLDYLEVSKALTEAVTTALVKVLGEPGTAYSELSMKWALPRVITPSTWTGGDF